MTARQQTIASGAELLALGRLIARHGAREGESACALPDVFLTSRTVANECQAAFEPSVMVFAQGKKGVRLGTKTYYCEAGDFLLSSIELPLGGMFVQASRQAPLLIFRLTLNMELARDVLASRLVPPLPASSRGIAMVEGKATSGLLNACVRLLALLDSPSDIPYMSALIQREILYRLLILPQGAVLRSIVTADDARSRIAKAVTWLKRNFAQPLKMSDLASIAGVSQSTLNGRFRSLTGLSPLQYQKMLRLFAAQDRMMLDGADASSAAFDVGYESISQFNREYRRQFGKPPMQDVRARRTSEK